MRIDLSLKHVEKSPLVENIVEKNIKKVSRRLKLFKTDEAVHLSVHVEKNPHKDEYFCWINLYLPFKVLTSRSRKFTMTIAVNDAFSAVLKQMDKFKHKLERHLHRKKSIEIGIKQKNIASGSLK